MLRHSRRNCCKKRVKACTRTGLVTAIYLILDHHLVPPLSLSSMRIRLSAEVLYMVVQQLDDLYDRPTLLTLATTARALSDAALDVLWAPPNLWNLAKRMDGSLWYIELTQETRGYEDGVRPKWVSDTSATMHTSTPNPRCRRYTCPWTRTPVYILVNGSISTLARYKSFHSIASRSCRPTSFHMMFFLHRRANGRHQNCFHDFEIFRHSMGTTTVWPTPVLFFGSSLQISSGFV
jgi:hypothetical protein